MNVAVIGGGVMGLTTAYELLKKGHQVTLFEAADRLGGMSASFDFDGLQIERFYHFICGPDKPYFNLLRELGIQDKLRWRATKMGYFYNGELYEWGNPIGLLTFPHLGILSKIRYGLHMFHSTKRFNWEKLDNKNAVIWIEDWVGQEAYDILWKKLFELKFHEFTNNLSAAWIWSRIKRVGLSRKNIFTERLGYLEGGSQVLIDSLRDKIISLGGKIHLNSSVKKIVVKNAKVTGVETGQSFIPFFAVISTIPLPYIPQLVKELPNETTEKYKDIKNISVVCVICKAGQPLTHNFWLNINDSRIDMPGVIEYSNLNPLSDHIVYIPFYLPQKHPYYKKDDNFFIETSKNYLNIINPKYGNETIKSMKVFRYEYAQPICPPGFLKQLPPVKTEIENLYVVDTSYYYPEDRSISESIRMGKQIASLDVCETTKTKSRMGTQFIKFLIAGGFAALVNFSIRLYYSKFFGFGTAVVLAYITGMITAFLMFKFLVFEKSRHKTTKELYFFTIVNILALFLTWIVSVGLAEYILPYFNYNFYREELAHSIGIIVPVFTSYLGHKYLSFRSQD